MKLTGSKAHCIIMALVLAIGLMPMLAYAAPSGEGNGSLTDIVAGVSPALSTQEGEELVAEGVTVEFEGAYTYTGKPITPDPVVKYNDATLVKEQDYTVVYSNNVDAGTATATVSLAGNFTGVAYGHFTIGPAYITSVLVGDADYVYNGYPIEPEITIMAGDIVVSKNACDIEYTDNVNAGTATVTVSMGDLGNIRGTKSATFTISQATLINLQLSADTFAYQRAPIVPDISMLLATGGIDVPRNGYDIECTNNENVGQATIKVTGKGNFKDSIERTFTIEPAQINGIGIYDTEHVYNGGPQEVAIAGVTAGAIELTKDDYTVSYSNNVDAGTATVTATAANPNFTGSASIDFTIDPRPIDSVEVKQGTYVYTGKEIKPDVTVKAGDIVLTKDDYGITYMNNVDAGTNSAKVAVAGAGNFSASLDAAFTINPATLTDATLDQIEFVYDGTEKKPAATEVKAGDLVVPNEAYDVAYDENVHALSDPTATITAKAGGNYAGSVVKKFAINPAPITAIELDQNEFVYDGTPKEPAVTAVKAGDLVVPDYAYDFDYADNVYATGQPMVWVGVKDGQDFTGELTQNFTIKPAKLVSMTLSPSSFVADGAPKNSVVTVNGIGGAVLVAGTDYEISEPTGRTEPGQYVYEASGLGNYTGTLTAIMTIEKADEPVTPHGWKKVDGKWYYYNADGSLVKSKWMKDSHGWVYLGADGAMVTNKWVRDSKGWCYVGSDGYMVKSKWQKDSAGWCYLGADGRMVTDKWAKDSKGWCYLGADGHMVSSKWIKDSKGWCYVGSDGYMVSSKWQKDSKGWCYLGADGRMIASDWQKISDKWYYFDANGHMVTGTQVINGKTYKFADNGAWLG